MPPNNTALITMWKFFLVSVCNWSFFIHSFKFWECSKSTAKDISVQLGLVQSLSHVQLFATPWTAALQASPSITNSCSLLKLMSIESVMPSNHLILCRPLHLPPSIFPSQGIFQWISSSHQVAKSCSFSFRIVCPVNIQDWFPLGWTGWISLQSKGLLRVFSDTTFQKHQFFGVQLSL